MTTIDSALHTDSDYYIVTDNHTDTHTDTSVSLLFFSPLSPQICCPAGQRQQTRTRALSVLGVEAGRQTEGHLSCPAELE